MEEPRNPGAHPTEAVGAAIVRQAGPDDATRLAALSGQLGYPATAAEMTTRLAAVGSDPRHAIFVVAEAGGTVVGWVHACLRDLLVSQPQAEIEGLVVDEACRSVGLGRQLLERAEEWARDQGCTTVFLRSNVTRERAHAFYERAGYQHVKTSKAFRKGL